VTRFHCARCGAEHDLAELEPSYAHPDPYLEIPAEERDRRSRCGNDHCTIWDPLAPWSVFGRFLARMTRPSARYFYRALLPIRVAGEAKPKCWGLWVEVSVAAARRVDSLWEDPDQGSEPPFRGTLANRLACYPDTSGLSGWLQLTGPTSIPSFTLDAGLRHPLAIDQREGVPFETAMEWLAAMHP
jgi:hypothetical protein